MDGVFIVLEVELHICGGERKDKRLEEISYVGRGESVDEIAESVVVEEVEDDESGSVRGGIRQVVIGAFSG